MKIAIEPKAIKTADSILIKKTEVIDDNSLIVNVDYVQGAIVIESTRVTITGDAFKRWRSDPALTIAELVLVELGAFRKGAGPKPTDPLPTKQPTPPKQPGKKK